jgi:hypothetical protein
MLFNVLAVRLALALALATGAAALENMNPGGEYLIMNMDYQNFTTTYDTNFGRKNAEYFDVYAGPISTRYGEVFWRGLPKVPVPDAIKKRFAGKAIAVIGYEQDQVMVTGAPGENPEKDKSVPIYWAYNHHYVAWLKGAQAEMVQLSGEDSSITGHPLHQMAYADPSTDPNPDSKIPTSQFFSEGNGGESRKSYHGYPKGMAQLIESVEDFVITPMQIDTWNRNVSYDDPRGFVPGPEGKRVMGNAPRTGPDAVYSGHLECPCTDRVIRTTEHTYATQATTTCSVNVGSAEGCFTAAETIGIKPTASELVTHAGSGDACATTLSHAVKTQCTGMHKAAEVAQTTIDTCREWCCNNTKTCSTYIYDTNPTHTGHTNLGCWYSSGACDVMKVPSKGSAWSGATSAAPPAPPSFSNITVSSTSLPAGCSVKSQNSSSLLVYWNTNAASKSQCGSLAPGTPMVLSGTATSLVTFGLKLALNDTDPTTKKAGVATLTITGPSDVWFGVGLGAQVMKDSPNAIIVTGNGTVFEQKLVNQGAGSKIATSVTVVSNTVVNKLRTVVLRRGLVGLTKDHYSFDPSQGTLNFINAYGKTGIFAYHQSRAASQMHLQVEGAPTCICNTGTKNYMATDMNPNKREFKKNCQPEPAGDLAAFKNPTCTLDAYRGGLKCCTSGNILLDKDQNPWEDHKLVYYMKWRFW